MATVGARLTTPSQKGPKGPNFNSPLYNPSQTLSGKQLAQAARQIANLQTQPVISGLKGQIRQNNQNTAGESRTDFNYYMQLAQDAKALVGQQQQANSQLQTQLQGIAGNTQDQLSQLGQQYTGGALGRLSQLGIGNDQIAQLQAQNAQGRGFAAQNAATAQTLGAQQGNNALAESRSLGAAGGLAGTEQISALARANAIANQPLNQKVSDEIAQRGALTGTALGQLRTAERQYQIAQAGVNLNKAQLAQTTKHETAQDKTAAGALGVAQTRANTAAALAKYNTNPNFIGSPAWERAQSQLGKAWSDDPNAVGSAAWARVQAANARSAAAAGKNAPKPLSTPSNNAWLRTLGQAVTLVKDGEAQGGTPAQVQDNLTSGANPQKKAFDPLAVEAALELNKYGTISPATARLMHQAGVRGGSYQNSPISVQAPPQGNPLAPRPAPPRVGATQNPLKPGSTGLNY